MVSPRLPDCTCKLDRGLDNASEKLVEAADISLVGSADAVQLLTAHMDHCLTVKQLEFEREKFREYCEAEVRRHEFAMQRLEHPEWLFASVSSKSPLLPDGE